MDEPCVFGEKKIVANDYASQTPANNFHTKLKQIERNRLVAKEAAEEADLPKNELLAYMGHEIRTPLNEVIGCTDLL